MSVQPSDAAVTAAQAPGRGHLNLDHVAHFVPDIEQAARDFEKLGFTLTPFSAQSHRLEHDGPLVPAGTANRCVMFERGYVECLTPIGDTANAAQLRAAIERYTGVHLIAFGTAAPDADHARLSAHGFAPTTPVALQREIGTPQGNDTARFTVVRVPPGTMPEGRIQFCQHHTAELLWQPRWLTHANGAVALNAVILCVEDVEQTVARYARFTGLKPAGVGAGRQIETQRGRLVFAAPATIRRVFNIAPPALPWIAGYVLASNDMDLTRRLITDTGYAHGELDRKRLYVMMPSSIGGIIVFESQSSPPFELGSGAA